MPDSAPQTAKVTPLQPPLGISHLMLWVLGAAVVLGMYRAIGNQSEATRTLQAVLVGNQLVFSLLAGINIAAVIVFARRLIVRDAPLFVQPGHWLLAIAGYSNVAAWTVVGLGAAVEWLRTEHSVVAETPPYHWLGYSLGSFLSFASYQVAAVVIREPLRWRLYFLISGLFSAALAATFAFMYLFSLEEAGGDRLYAAARWYSCLYPLDQVVAIVFLGFNVLADRVNRRPRDWLHGVGVATTLLQSIASLVSQWLLAWASAGAQN